MDCQNQSDWTATIEFHTVKFLWFDRFHSLLIVSIVCKATFTSPFNFMFIVYQGLNQSVVDGLLVEVLERSVEGKYSFSWAPEIGS